MKRVICLFLTVLSFSICFAQQKVAKVTLKSGATITGTIVELNPVSHLVIQVAGINSRIEMMDVSSIDDVFSVTTEMNSVSSEENNAGPVILDQENYPESFLLKVGPYDVEMVLVRGALFDMGYDGRGSMSKHSEPVHKVQLSSFYVNKAALSKDLVSYLKTGKEKHSDKDIFYSPGTPKDALEIVETLPNITKQPFTLITEAQCEYILSSDNIDIFDLCKIERILCNDYYSDYRNSSKPQVDPTGPQEGKNRFRVVRDFTAKGADIYTRYTHIEQKIINTIRVSIPASQLISR